MNILTDFPPLAEMGDEIRCDFRALRIGFVEWFGQERLRRSTAVIENAAYNLRRWHDSPEVAHSTRLKSRYMPRISYVTELDNDQRRDVFWMVECNKKNVAVTHTTIIVLNEGKISEIAYFVQDKRSQDPVEQSLTYHQEAAQFHKLSRELQNPDVLYDLSQTTSHE